MTDRNLQFYNVLKVPFREGQEELINKFIDFAKQNNKKYLLFQGATGIGKSLIALTSAKYLAKNMPDFSMFITSSKNILLDQYSRDLTVAAKEGKLDPVVGRNSEIERVIQILSRRTKNNPCLIGEPGVGKTAIVEGLANRIVKGDVPNSLKDKTIFVLFGNGFEFLILQYVVY